MITAEPLRSHCPGFLNKSVFKYGLRVKELFILAVMFLFLEKLFKGYGLQFYLAELPTILLGVGFIMLNRLAEDNFVEKAINYYRSKRRFRASLLKENA